MNAKTNPDKPKVTIAATTIISAHNQSPLISAGKKPKKNVVQEKPTGASLTTPVLLLNVIVAKAIKKNNILSFFSTVIFMKKAGT